jgi:hypothetical protein
MVRLLLVSLLAECGGARNEAYVKDVAVSCALIATPLLAAAAPPVLFFFDLDSAPNSGWLGSTPKGAAVTGWDPNLGGPATGSKLTAAGAELTSNDTVSIGEWGATENSARGLERITSSLNSSFAAGATGIRRWKR